MAKRKSDAEKKKSQPTFVSVYEQVENRVDKPKNKGGRPSKYNEELADRFCRKVATTTLGLEKLCASDPEFPCADTIYQWRIDFPSFSEKYTIAKQKQADILIEEIMDIADTCANNYENGSEYVMATRLQIDTRKWFASKLLPKVYGDKVQNETVVTISHEKAVEALG